MGEKLLRPDKADAWNKMVKRMLAVSATRDFGLIEVDTPQQPLSDEQQMAALAADIAAISGIYTVASGDGISYRPRYPGTH